MATCLGTPHEYQILAALFNAAKCCANCGRRRERRVLTAGIADGGRQKLTPMQEGAAACGGVFDLPVFDLYRVKCCGAPWRGPYNHRP